MNIGVPELLIVLVVLALPAIIVLVVLLATRGSRGSGTEHRHHTALVSDPTPEAFLQRAAAAVAGLRNHTIGGVGSATLVVTRSYFATWRIVVAVLLFPVGLIALLSRDNDTAAVSAVVDGGMVRVTLDGAFDGALVERLNTVLD